MSITVEQRQAYNRRMSTEITDVYIAQLLGVPVWQLSTKLIEAKRAQLIIKRYVTGSKLLREQDRQWVELSQEEKSALRKAKNAELRKEAQARYYQQSSAQLTKAFITKSLTGDGIPRTEITDDMIARKRQSIIQWRSKRRYQTVMAQRRTRSKASVPREIA